MYKDGVPVCKFLRDSHKYNSNDRSISVLSNSQFCVQSLETIVQRAHIMFKEKAYIYQYEKYGLDQDTFRESLEIVEGVLNHY